MQRSTNVIINIPVKKTITPFCCLAFHKYDKLRYAEYHRKAKDNNHPFPKLQNRTRFVWMRCNNWLIDRLTDVYNTLFNKCMCYISKIVHIFSMEYKVVILIQVYLIYWCSSRPMWFTFNPDQITTNNIRYETIIAVDFFYSLLFLKPVWKTTAAIFDHL